MINWNSIKHFKSGEFPDDTSLVAPQLITLLDTFRSVLNRPITPSPVPGALARLDGSSTSQHYAVGRLSTAVDIFCHADPSVVLIQLLQFNKFGGIGVYTDTHLGGLVHTMFHVDIRTRTSKKFHGFEILDMPVIWERDMYGYRTLHEFEITDLIRRLAERSR